MATVNVPSHGDRRLRTSRLVGALLAALAVVAVGYFLLREKPAAESETSEASKDIAALFHSIQGNVKTRGVGGLDWKTADLKTPLRKSDLVRTYPSASAEIRFFDDTRVTVRPDSLITIEETSRDPQSSSGKVAWRVSSGEINYETKQKGPGSTEAVTPTFRLALEGNSAGTMRVDEGGRTAVEQISGAANIETKSGEKIRLGANEGLRVDAAGKAGAKQALPEPPKGAVPGTSGVLSLSEGAPVALGWTASSGAAMYRLQLQAKEAGTEEMVLDRSDLTGTSISLPGLGGGDFSFRVAGLTKDGVQGKFSEAVSFRVERTIAAATPALAAPLLVIEAFEVRGNVLRLAGKTEPGARLTVNGDAVTVQPDGSFREFVTLAQKQGGQKMVIRSTSRSGGVSEETRTLTPGQ